MEQSFKTPGAGVLIGLLLATFLFSVEAQGLDALVLGINTANKNGQDSCGFFNKTCLGAAVKVTLTESFVLNGDLPSLSNGAHLIVEGNCTGKDGKRCQLDGALNHSMFTFLGEPNASPAKLELRDLILERSTGAIKNVWAAVTATRVTFQKNINTAVKMVGAFGGFPPQRYDNCKFIFNSGSAIYAGNSKLGLAADGKNGFTVKNSVFSKNSAGSDSFFGGGAVFLAGLGTSVFDNVKFIKNTSPAAGGAIFGDQTYIKFRKVVFTDNYAATGGGAVAADTGFYWDSTTSFCSSTFGGNGSDNETASNLYFKTSNPGFKTTVHFCDTVIPPGSVLVEGNAGGSVTEGKGDKCWGEYC